MTHATTLAAYAKPQSPRMAIDWRVIYQPSQLKSAVISGRVRNAGQPQKSDGAQLMIQREILLAKRGKIMRNIIIEGEIAKIELTRGFIAFVDAADLHLVGASAWRSMVRAKTTYAYGTVISPDGVKVSALMHRLIMGIDGPEVDHIDGNGLNNRRKNLRHVTSSQNKWNKPLNASANKYGLVGVHRAPRSVKWNSQIKMNGVVHYLGSFDTPQQASEAYIAAKARMHGGFVQRALGQH